MDTRSQADPAARLTPPRPVLLYDGECGLCTASVQLVLRHDHAGTLRFAPLRGAFGTAVRARHPELLDVDSIVWYEAATPVSAERTLVQANAALALARYLGGWWRLALLARVLPPPIRDWAYSLIARHRHQLTPAGRSCLVPLPADRARFLP